MVTSGGMVPMMPVAAGALAAPYVEASRTPLAAPRSAPPSTPPNFLLAADVPPPPPSGGFSTDAIPELGKREETPPPPMRQAYPSRSSSRAQSPVSAWEDGEPVGTSSPSHVTSRARVPKLPEFQGWQDVNPRLSAAEVKLVPKEENTSTSNQSPGGLRALRSERLTWAEVTELEALEDLEQVENCDSDIDGDVNASLSCSSTPKPRSPKSEEAPTLVPSWRLAERKSLVTNSPAGRGKLVWRKVGTGHETDVQEVVTSPEASDPKRPTLLAGVSGLRRARKGKNR